MLQVEHTDRVLFTARVAREGELCCLGIWRCPEVLRRRVEGHRAWHQDSGEPYHYVSAGDVVRKEDLGEGRRNQILEHVPSRE